MTTTTEATVDQDKTAAFVGRVLADTSASMITMLCAVGDRLGFFRDLAARGPATSAEFAGRTGTDERYAREWLSAAGRQRVPDVRPGQRCFTLPPEHVPALAQESGPYFFGGVHQMLTGSAPPSTRWSSRSGRAAGCRSRPTAHDWWDGMERFTAAWFENLLLQEWIPVVPAARDKLERGAAVADVGCGRGRALIKLAQAYPSVAVRGLRRLRPIGRRSHGQRPGGRGRRPGALRMPRRAPAASPSATT